MPNSGLETRRQKHPAGGGGRRVGGENLLKKDAVIAFRKGRLEVNVSATKKNIGFSELEKSAGGGGRGALGRVFHTWSSNA